AVRGAGAPRGGGAAQRAGPGPAWRPRADGPGPPAETAKQLQAVRAQLAALSLQSPASGQEAVHRQQLARLAAQEQALSKRLGRGARGQGEPWVDLDEVRRALPADAVLIEVARLRVRDFAAPGRQPVWREPHYVAWLVPPRGKGEVRVLDLGRADKIEEAIEAVRRELRNVPPTLLRDEAAQERAFRRPLEAL